MKFNPMKQIIKGKRIVIVDDSIVRGTTMKKLVEVLRKSGVKKIHLRICSPPVRFPCYFGVDTPNRRNFIAHAKPVDERKEIIGSDSLHDISLKGLIKASRQVESTLCTGCFTGKYPVNINYNFSKEILEKNC